MLMCTQAPARRTCIQNVVVNLTNTSGNQGEGEDHWQVDD